MPNKRNTRSKRSTTHASVPPPVPVASAPDTPTLDALGAEVQAHLESLKTPALDALGVEIGTHLDSLKSSADASSVQGGLEFALDMNIRRVMRRPFSVAKLKELEETARLSRLLLVTAQKHKNNG